MITPIILLNPHTAVRTGTLLRHLLDLNHTSIVLHLPLKALLLIVLLTRLACMKRLVVCSADEEIARAAAEYVAFDAAVVDLAWVATRAETVAEVGDGAEDAASGEFVELVVVVRVASLELKIGRVYRAYVSAEAKWLICSWVTSTPQHSEAQTMRSQLAFPT